LNKKGKALSLVAVLALVLSMVALVPAISVGAATAGTIKLSRTVYSLSASTGTDSLSETSAYNVVKVQVKDADVNVTKTATARFAQTAASSFTIASAASITGTAVTGESPTGAIDGSNKVYTTKNSPLGDKDGDGDVDTSDVVVKVAGTAVSVSSITASSGAITLAAAPAVGATVTVDYSDQEYITGTPASSPVASVVSIKQGTNVFGKGPFNYSTGVVQSTSSTASGGGLISIEFTYDVVDTIADVVVSSETNTGLGLTNKITLTETGAATGIFEGTITLEAKSGGTSTKLDVGDGDTITATYADASPVASIAATGSVDLTPPAIALVSPTNALITKDTKPVFEVEVSDAGAPITTEASVELVINGAAVGEVKTALVGATGFKLHYAQVTALTDAAYSWYVTATDAVGNSVADPTTAATFITGSSDKPFTVTVDNTKVASFTAKTGSNVDAAGTNRTTNDTTGVQLTFNEAIDGSTVAASDFTVAGVAPTDARHYATLKNTESFVADGSQTTFDVSDYTVKDTDADTKYADEFVVTVAGVATAVVADAVGGTDVNTAKVATAPAANAAVTVTYTYTSSKEVYLTIPAQATSNKPKVILAGDVADVAGNSAVALINATSTDTLKPVITASLSAATVGDTDNDGDADAVLTITSSEALAAVPTIPAVTNVSFGTVTAVTGSTTSWTSAITSSTSATYSIKATGADAASNSGTSTAVSLVVDVTDPALTTEAGEGTGFDPAVDTADTTPYNIAYQGLDNITRAVANFSETTTLVSSTLDDVDVSADTFVQGKSWILAQTIAAGDHTWKVTVQDAASNASSAQTLKFTVKAPTASTVALEPGWNLISVPARLDIASLGTVFGDDSPQVTKVRTWNSTDGWQVSNNADGAWTGDILAVKEGVGYWVWSSNANDLSVTLRRIAGIPSPAQPQAVSAGWNLVGPQFLNMPTPSSVGADSYLSNTDWSVAYGFDPDPAVGFTRATPKDETPDSDTLLAGSGYWVYFNVEGDIIP